jgi:acetyl-CoA acyltransferase
VDFGAQVLKDVLARVPSLDASDIDDVIVGCAKPEKTQGMNLGRILAQRAGLPEDVPGKTVNRFCASSLEAVSLAANEIMAGQSRVLVAGGVESMTAIPLGGDADARNSWLAENSNIYMPMGITAENVADRWHVTRQDMDALAVLSHRKAAAAVGSFQREIVPIEVTGSEDGPFLFDRDQGIRAETTPEALAGLEPSFKQDGKVTAGNASQVSDGAAFVVLMEAGLAKARGIEPWPDSWVTRWLACLRTSWASGR